MWENKNLGVGEIKNLVCDIKVEIMVIYFCENSKKEFRGKFLIEIYIREWLVWRRYLKLKE